MTDQDRRRYPTVYAFEGRPSDDGSALLVEATAFDGTALRFALPLDNVQHFIAFLLLWVGTISATQQGGQETATIANGQSLPVPATSIAIGEPAGEEGYIAISIGRAELVFSVPVSSFGALGETLLLAGNAANAIVA